MDVVDPRARSTPVSDGGYLIPGPITEALLKKLAGTDVLMSPLMTAISNQVEIDAMNLERRLVWESRRASMSEAERELEDLNAELFELEWGINAKD